MANKENPHRRRPKTDMNDFKVTIHGVRRNEFTDREYLNGEVEFEDGESWGVSRYPDEEAWVVDSRFGADLYPHWVHGGGSRCTTLITIGRDNELGRAVGGALDDAAIIEARAALNQEEPS